MRKKKISTWSKDEMRLLHKVRKKVKHKKET